MQYATIDDFLKDAARHLAKGPVALVLAEDAVALEPTLAHHLGLGFARVIVFMAPHLHLPETVAADVIRVDHAVTGRGAHADIVNPVIRRAGNIWLYYCFNAEFLFYPFSEDRSVAEMLAFHTEERRDAMLTYVVDLYANDLDACPDAVSMEAAHLDRSGYYALARKGRDGHPRERQLDFFGGLRWRFEEHIPKDRRRIDRISLFRAKSGLTLLPDHRFDDEEYNTYSCPWHHNLTAAVCSFRTAKALKRNPGSTFDIPSFTWHNSVPFAWESRQLMDLGLMEPGQWF